MTINLNLNEDDAGRLLAILDNIYESAKILDDRDQKFKVELDGNDSIFCDKLAGKIEDLLKL